MSWSDCPGSTPGAGARPWLPVVGRLSAPVAVFATVVAGTVRPGEAAWLTAGFAAVTLAVVAVFRRSAEFVASPPSVQAFVGAALGLVAGAVLGWALLFLLWAPAWSAG